MYIGKACHGAGAGGNAVKLDNARAVTDIRALAGDAADKARAVKTAHGVGVGDVRHRKPDDAANIVPLLALRAAVVFTVADKTDLLLPDNAADVILLREH